MIRLLHITILAALLAIVAPTGPVAAQDLSVQASVDETRIGTEDRVVYTIEIHGAAFSDVDTPSAPSAEGLALVQSYPSTQRNMTFVNGQLRQSIAFRWTYRPLRQGSAKIAAIDVKVKGQTYQTAPIELTVMAQAQRPGAPQQNPPSASGGESVDGRTIRGEDLFIRAIPSKRRAYRNEQITIEYQLFFRDGVQLRNSRLAGSWDAEGFWREEFEVDTRPIPRPTVESGRRYSSIVLKRVAVFPTRTGSMRVDPLRIETEAYVPSRSSDPFDQFFSLRNRFDVVDVSSGAVNIEVVPLPGSAPASFSGAVGSFQMQARVDRRTVEVGEPIQVEVRISGSGNIATLDAPAFEPPGVFEQYDPEIKSSVTRDESRIRGTKTFIYILVPRSNGTFQIPPVNFSFFDPQSERYETVQSEPVEVEVTGDAAPLAAGTTASGLPFDDIAGPMTAAGSWTATDTTPLHRRPWAYGALGLPLLVLAGLVAFRRRATRLATDENFARGRRAHPLARRHLKEAETLLRRNEPRRFYEEVSRAVLGFIGNRMNVAELGLTRPQLDARLDTVGVSPQMRAELRRLLDECDQALYAPVLPDRAAMESACDRASGLIVAIDDAVSKQPAT